MVRTAVRTTTSLASSDRPSGARPTEPKTNTLRRVHGSGGTVADRPYFTAYSGPHSPTGELIGMLYVGIPLDPMPG